MREGWLRPSLSASVRASVVCVRPSVRLFFLLANGAPGRGRRPLLPPSASPLRNRTSGEGVGWIIAAAAVSLSSLSGCVELTGIDKGCRLDCSWGSKRTCADGEFGKVDELVHEFRKFKLRSSKFEKTSILIVDIFPFHCKLMPYQFQPPNGRPERETVYSSAGLDLRCKKFAARTKNVLPAFSKGSIHFDEREITNF